MQLQSRITNETEILLKYVYFLIIFINKQYIMMFVMLFATSSETRG